MNTEAGKKVNSVRCNFPPGGQSNFQMGWGQSTEPVVKSTKYSAKNYSSNNNYDSVNINDKENVNKSNIVAGVCTQNKECGYGQNKVNLFSGYQASEKSTSIKVNQNPGGKSSVCFGTDSSNYEEYRRK